MRIITAEKLLNGTVSIQSAGCLAVSVAAAPRLTFIELLSSDFVISSTWACDKERKIEWSVLGGLFGTELNTSHRLFKLRHKLWCVH